MDRLKLSTCVLLSIVCVLFIGFGIWLYLNFEPSATLIFVWIFIALILVVASGVNWVYWMWQEYLRLDEDRRRIESITPMIEAANTIMRLTREQLDFLKLNGYYAARGILATDDGPLSVLLTPRGNIPWESAVAELRASTVLGLRAIRETSDGSPEREWRRLFTAWCVDMGLAIPANGRYAALWVDKNSRSIVAGRMGVALYEDATEDDE